MFKKKKRTFTEVYRGCINAKIEVESPVSGCLKPQMYVCNNWYKFSQICRQMAINCSAHSSWLKPFTPFDVRYWISLLNIQCIGFLPINQSMLFKRNGFVLGNPTIFILVNRALKKHSRVGNINVRKMLASKHAWFYIELQHFSGLNSTISLKVILTVIPKDISVEALLMLIKSQTTLSPWYFCDSCLYGHGLVTRVSWSRSR